MQQACIVFDHADSISRFTDQWAVYLLSPCLRVTPYYFLVDQKAARRQFVAMLSQLPPNTNDIHLAPLIHDLGAKDVNVPLSMNSYKLKRWAYVTFPSQELLDAAMEQTIGFHSNVLAWGLPNDVKGLCHRCGKLGCASTACPFNQKRGRSRTHDPLSKLKEHFHIGQQNQRNHSSHTSRSRSHSKSRDRSASQSRSNVNAKSNDQPNSHNSRRPNNNKGKDRSVSFSSSFRTPVNKAVQNDAPPFLLMQMTYKTFSSYSNKSSLKLLMSVHVSLHLNLTTRDLLLLKPSLASLL
ncbi:hypothetical protein C1646_789640, partial [Rhizophagus diaphanus]